MAYQPKSYKKFVATAATATLVATAIAPTALAATFTDVSSTYKTAVDYLIANNIAKGKTETTFGTSATITRGDAAVMIASALKLDTTKAPDAGFKDVNARVAGAVNALVDAKIVSGKTATTFAPDANITRQEMAKIVTNAYKLEAGTTKNTFVDVNSNWDAFVDALVANEITLGKTATTFASTSPVTRGEFALFVYRSETLVPATPEVVSVSAIASKSLKVTFNQPIDTTKAAFELKKDGIKANTSTITWNANKTEATIELTSKITKGEYVVSVSNVVEGKILTGTVVAADEKISKIEVLTTEVPLSDSDADGNTDDIVVPYKVTNQYGEDVTKTASILASSGVVDATNGVVTFEGNYDTTTNKTVAFTLINVESNVSTSAVVTAVAKSIESAVEVKGIYNKDGKTLSETTDLTKDKFFLEVEVKDQYGKVITSPSASSLLISETNNTVVDVKDVTQTPVLDTTTVAGKVLIAIENPATGIKAGTSTITLISKNTGKSSATTVTVAEGVRANNVTLGQPELVAAGEDALIPVVALDKEGKEITDLAILNSPTRGLNVGANTLVKKDNVVYLKVATPAEGPNVAMVTVIPSQKIVTVNYTVRAAVKPTVITGLDSTIQTSISNGLTQVIKGQDLVVEDQYGRVMSDTAVNAWLNVPANSIVLTSTLGTPDVSPFTVASTATGADTAKQVITAHTDAFTLTAKTTAGLNNTEKLTFALSTDAGLTSIASTSKDVVFSKVGVADFASFEVVAPSKIYNEDNSEFSFKVYGVKADGSKTLLKSDQYNLVAPSDFGVAAGAVNNNTLELVTALTTIDTDGTTPAPVSKDFTFKVVVADTNATTVSKVITVSAEDRTVASFAASTDGTSDGDALTSLTYEASTSADDAAILNLSSVASDAGTLDLNALEQNLYYVDQYGNETAGALGNVNLTFSNLVDADNTVAAAITGNGSTTAQVTNLEAGDTVKVKIETGALAGQTFTVTIK